MSKWTYQQSLQKQQNADLDNLQIFSIPEKPLYHYTSREVFWKIMDSETFLARHIMFSNDYEENKIGNQKVADALKDAGIEVRETGALPFMICFCADDDLLSQWRGYAKEGVAMEFDFSKGLYGLEKGFSTYNCYTIMNNESENEAYLSKDVDKFFMGAIASPYSVIYTEANAEQSGNKDSVIDSRIQKIKGESRDMWWQRAVEMIPYIKNNKFREENEYRLIFDMNFLVSESQQHLLQQKYTYLEIDGVRKPNIRVKFGNMLEYENEDTTLYYVDSDLDDSIRTLKQELKKEKIKLKTIRKPRQYRMATDEVLVSAGVHQEEVCTKLRRILHQRPATADKISIWCDGHLPVRRIVVAPSKDAELMKCSIEEYIKTKYWAKDIKVEISRIPLRL